MEKNNLQMLKERLRKQKEQLDEQLKAIEIVEQMLGEGIDNIQYHIKPQSMNFSAISQEDACRQVLGKDPTKMLSVKNVTDQLIEGGYKFATDKPKLSVAVTLRRMANENKIIKKIQIKPGRVAYQALNKNEKGSESSLSEPLNLGDVGERLKPTNL